MHRYLIPPLIALLVIGQAQAGLILFSPGSSQISSAAIYDVTNCPNGEVVFGTDNGLSWYNGSWKRFHRDYTDAGAGLLSETVLAVEYDSTGTLWIGHSGGLQWYNGTRFSTLTDQQILKNLKVNDLQRWDDEMWVATGNAGVHRVVDGRWIWYKPHGEGGLGCYSVTSMAVDAEDEALYVAAYDGGIWVLSRSEGAGIFESLLEDGRPAVDLTQVRRDPAGGVYLFGPNRLVHYSARHGFTPVCAVAQLEEGARQINDVAAGPDGDLWVAADNGLYQFSVNGILHLSKDDGIWGTVVRTVFIDHEGRCWFATPGNVGFYFNPDIESPIIDVDSPHLLGFPSADNYATAPVTSSPPLAPVIEDNESSYLEIILRSPAIGYDFFQQLISEFLGNRKSV
jgi:ligand-binding sensor domain-containing protein